MEAVIAEEIIARQPAEAQAEKRQKVVAVTAETLQQSFRLLVLPGRGNQLVQPRMQAIPPADVLRHRSVFPAAQAYAVAHQTPQFLGKYRPMGRRALVTFDVRQVAEQTRQAGLPRRADRGVVRSLKVGHQCAAERLAEEPRHHRLIEAPAPTSISTGHRAGFGGCNARGCSQAHTVPWRSLRPCCRN